MPSFPPSIKSSRVNSDGNPALSIDEVFLWIPAFAGMTTMLYSSVGYQNRSFREENYVDEFKKFAMRGNVVDMAVV